MADGVVYSCYLFQNLIFKIGGVLFHGALFLGTDQFFQTLPSLTGYNSLYEAPQYEAPQTNFLYIFGILRTAAFTWWCPGYIQEYQNLKKIYQMQKNYFFGIFLCPLRKNSSGRHLDNINAIGLPNTSFESWHPKVFREHVKNFGIFQIGGSRLQSHLIQICVRKKEAVFGENPCFDWLWQCWIIYIVGKLWI